MDEYPRYENRTLRDNNGTLWRIAPWLVKKAIIEYLGRDNVLILARTNFPDMEDYGAINGFIGHLRTHLDKQILGTEMYRQLLRSRPKQPKVVFIDTAITTKKQFMKKLKQLDIEIEREIIYKEWHREILVPYMRTLIYPKVREFEENEGIQYTLLFKRVFQYIRETPGGSIEERSNQYLSILSTLDRLKNYSNNTSFPDVNIRTREALLRNYPQWSPVFDAPGPSRHTDEKAFVF